MKHKPQCEIQMAKKKLEAAAAQQQQAAKMKLEAGAQQQQAKASSKPGDSSDDDDSSDEDVSSDDDSSSDNDESSSEDNESQILVYSQEDEPAEKDLVEILADDAQHGKEKEFLLNYDFAASLTISSDNNQSDDNNQAKPMNDEPAAPPPASSADDQSSQQSSLEEVSEESIHSALKRIQKRTRYTKDANKPPRPLPTDIEFGIKLMSTLPPKSPLYLFDEIIKLIETTYKEQCFMLTTPKRSKIQDVLVDRYHLSGLKPKTSPVSLTGDPLTGPGPYVQVTTISFLEGVNYLLHHIRDSPPESLLIDPDDPFKAPIPVFTNNTKFGEFSTGKRFNKAYSDCRLLHKNPKGIPLPINLEVDKTHLDASGKLTFEQVRQSIPWLVREEMYYPAAWVGLGSVPNSVNIPKSHHAKGIAQGLASNRDYHAILNHILSEMKQVYRSGGLQCNLALPKRVPGTNQIEVIIHKNVSLYPYLLYVNGDTEGHNKLCSLKSNSHCNCRICNVLKADSGRPDAEFESRRMNQLKRTVTAAMHGEQEQKEKAILELNDACIYVTPNAFYQDIEFFDSVNNFAGVFGVCPPELLHYLQKGKYCYVLEGFYEQPKTKQQNLLEKMRLKCLNELKASSPPSTNSQPQTQIDSLPPSNNNEREIQTESADGSLKRKADAETEPSNKRPAQQQKTDNESNRKDKDSSQEKKKRQTYAIPKSRHKLVNALASEVGKDITHGSEPDTPRLLFPHGVTSTTHRSCSEMTGLMLFMLILLSTKCGMKIAHIKQNRVRNGWIVMLERFLLYEAFLRCTKPKDLRVIMKVKGYLIYLMYLYKHVVDRSSREKGDGDNIIKFHLTLHMVDMIIMYGLPANFTGGPHESRHIFFAKETGETSQKRIQSLDFQIAQRQVFATALNCYQQERIREHSKSLTLEKTGQKVLYGARYIYDYTHRSIVDFPQPGLRARRTQSHWVDSHLQSRVTKFLEDLLSESFVAHKQDITIFTELREERKAGSRPTKLYRAHPEFTNDKTKKSYGWFDWCFVKWPVRVDGQLEETEYPCHIRSFVELPRGLLDPNHNYEGLHSYTVETPESTTDFAIIKTTSQQKDFRTSQHRKSWFFTKGTKFCSPDSQDPDLYLVPVSHLCGYLSAFRDPVNYNKQTLEIYFRRHGYIFLKPISQWSDRFVELADEFSQLDSEQRQKRCEDFIDLSSIHDVFHNPDDDSSDEEIQDIYDGDSEDGESLSSCDDEEVSQLGQRFGIPECHYSILAENS